MQRPRQRPRFDLEVDLPPDEVIARIQRALARTRCPCEGDVRQRHAWIHVRRQDRHFWSPTLDLTVEPTEFGARLHGRFAPHPSIWTFFVFVYAALGAASTVAFCWGLAQLSLGSRPFGLAISAALLALIGFVYGAAFIGQGLGSDQIAQMRIFLDRAVVRGHESDEPGDGAEGPQHRADRPDDGADPPSA
ncbi:MAG: hypothetical protein D6798_18245 [Deltaproteobacteria bacterium]|nr:MAG: hypothetical protein D6798_18245 [Deltaproteobacteria bacterium]